jgi:hypothetical protein
VYIVYIATYSSTGIYSYILNSIYTKRLSTLYTHTIGVLFIACLENGEEDGGASDGFAAGEGGSDIEISGESNPQGVANTLWA